MAKKIDNLKIDPTLNWKIAEILEINLSGIKFKTLKGLENYITFKNLNGLSQIKKLFLIDLMSETLFLLKKKIIFGALNNILK